MELGVLSKTRPISCSDSPAFQRLQTSRFSIAESPNRFPGLIQHHLSGADLHQMVLHRPIECTALIVQVPRSFTTKVITLRVADRPITMMRMLETIGHYR